MRNGRTLLLLAFLLFAFPCCAQTGSVTGVVTDSVTGSPVPRAHVSLIGDRKEPYTAMSGLDGKFTVTGLPAGQYTSEVQRVGFVGRALDFRVAPGGNGQATLEIALTPTGAITGRVTDADGEPVKGAQVFPAGEGIAEGMELTNTDEKGQFRIGGLRPGKYHVKASFSPRGISEPPEVRTDGTAEQYYADTWYPGVLALKDAGRVEVRGGVETPGVGIRLVHVPFVRVSGRVVGMPRAAESAQLEVSHGGWTEATNLKPDGAFEVWRLDPGKYKLTASWKDPDGLSVQTGGVQIEVAGPNIDNIELREVADSNISGQLVFDDDETKQMILKDLPGPLVQPFEMGAAASGMPSAQADRDGKFLLEKIQPGKYWIGFADDKAYVKSMRLGSTAIDGAVLDLTKGSGGAGLTLHLAMATGSISGSVQAIDGIAAGTTVVLVEAGEETGFDARRTVAGADGTYTFEKLPPGSYKLVATEEARPEIHDNDVVGYEDLMEEVKVEAKEKVTKDLARQSPSH